jgi:hypothetical protein
MTDKEIIDEFTRESWDSGRLVIQVLSITWPYPHEPQSHWITVTNLPEDADQASIEEARAKAIKRRRYFAVCEECGERKPVGWMNDEHICQSCAEKNHGVVY